MLALEIARMHARFYLINYFPCTVGMSYLSVVVDKVRVYEGVSSLRNDSDSDRCLLVVIVVF